MTSRANLYQSDKVGFGINSKFEKAITEVTKLVGIELYLNQEWIIKKHSAMTLEQSLAAKGAIIKLK